MGKCEVCGRALGITGHFRRGLSYDCVKIGYDRSQEALAAANARAEKAEAEHKQQLDSMIADISLRESLAAARRECADTVTAMRATHLMCGTCETDIYGEDGILVTSQVADCPACKVLRDVLAGNGPCPSTLTCGELFYRCALEPGHDGPHADREAGDVRAAEWSDPALAAPAAGEEG